MLQPSPGQLQQDDSIRVIKQIQPLKKGLETHKNIRAHVICLVLMLFFPDWCQDMHVSAMHLLDPRTPRNLHPETQFQNVSYKHCSL